MFFIISTLPASAQTIGGNVYGGGNSGFVGGNTTVTVKGGTMENVFGGARMANVGGRAYVNIDGEDATGNMLITNVFGGNDIAGQIGTSTMPLKTEEYPTGLTDVLTGTETKETEPEKNAIDDSWNAYVRTSRSTETIDNEGQEEVVEKHLIVIGTLFGGGNGDYDYDAVENTPEVGKTTHYIYQKGDHTTPIATKVTDTDDVGFRSPDLAKTYLELKGGCIGHVFGGGNNTTVTENTTISVNNKSDDLESVVTRLAGDAGYTPAEALRELQTRVKLNPFQANLTSYAFNFARIFGGNNMADMAIRPTWNLQSGRIRDLYSGGNEGRMTSPEGLLMELDPVVANRDKLRVQNVYGGCRRADVRPLRNGEDVSAGTLPNYKFPPGLAARVLVKGGHINNVYGGNDISGTVYGGNALGIYTTVYGDVYGGGNGSYAYTDNATLGAKETFKDFYYDPGDNSVDSLRNFRPNAEQVSIRLAGTEEAPTIIHGSVFCGGSSASLASKKEKPLVELKIGSYVTAEKVFLGNNGAHMVGHDVLRFYRDHVDDSGNIVGSGGYEYSSLDLTDGNTFANYMEGVAMNLQPSVVFDKISKGDPADYVDYTTKIGSFFCGGNVGSMAVSGKNSFLFDRGLVVFEKLVGGCNSADVEEQSDDNGKLCASYQGGILGTKEERDSYTDASGNIKDRLEMDLSNLIIMPMRWKDTYAAIPVGTTLTAGNTYYTSDTGTGAFVADGSEVVTGGSSIYELSVEAATELVWNTVKWDEDNEQYVRIDSGSSAKTDDDNDRRLVGGNVYGGCYNSGHVNGNVIININQDLLKKEEIFADTKEVTDGDELVTVIDDSKKRRSGVIFENQRDDLEDIALTVFGAGYGYKTEIWGSTTVNLNNGYALQVFGGGEQGIVGKKNADGKYEYNAAYSSTVNLNGLNAGYSEEESGPALAEAEYLYGGGNEGDVCGNSYAYLGDGRLYGAFGGACDANILGHTEMYIGLQKTGSNTFRNGFPWVRANVFGGNDFSGEIRGSENFASRIRTGDFDVMSQLHNPGAKATPDVLTASSYVEYLQGRVDSIFGGSYGYYDYTLNQYKDENDEAPSMPRLESAFVHIRPNTDRNSDNLINGVFGAGTGYPNAREGDKSQDRSYILVDIPDGITEFASTLLFGAGSYNGLGMRFTASETTAVDGEGNPFDLDQASSVIDLVRGNIQAAFGGSYNEGVTRRTVVNVPVNSTIHINDIFGGAFGTQILPPCDVYESHVNYRNTSENARVTGAIFGGNNSERRTVYGHVNISSPVWSDKENNELATVYGAGRGLDTWSEYTEVNLESGAKVKEVYGGGQMGHVLSTESVQKYMQLYRQGPSPQIKSQDDYWSQQTNIWEDEENRILKSEFTERWKKDWENAWIIGDYYVPNSDYTNYVSETKMNLGNDALTREAEMDERAPYNATTNPKGPLYPYKYDTNVLIHEGATVTGYAYGGGLGETKTHLSGDIYGTTYIALLGGTVGKDIYAAGTSGAVCDLFDSKNFTASANAYIKGGSVRNVYGGGWKGGVGYHPGDISASTEKDIVGETHVVIGTTTGTSFADGIPTIQRNAYGGGEGGAVYGTAYLTLNNGYVGYEYKEGKYVEKIEDETYTDKETGTFVPNTRLYDSGCIFGGGYIDNSNVDKTRVTLYGGHVRNSVFGGGEIAAIGRGSTKLASGKSIPELEGIYRPGKTDIEMYGGHVHRNVYGGGRGYNNLSEHGKLNCDGYVFGQTEVHIHGGEVGTRDGVAQGYGNVFGGGDVGYVYSAYENADGTFGRGVKTGVRYEQPYQGYYYKHNWDTGNNPGQDESLFLHENGTERVFSEDCKVLVAPHCKAKSDTGTFTDIFYGKGERVTSVDYNYIKENASGLLANINANREVTAADGIKFSRSYPAGSYVPIAALNTLKKKNVDSNWANLDATGIIINNAVFAGGNTSIASSGTSANATTVFGNATASIHDAYHRDLITLGTGHIGGLYGDGNLTFVDGYRELNITNYGTDYYSIEKEINIGQYHALPEREAAYYELIYTCKKQCTDKENTVYRPKDPENANSKASTITADDFLILFDGVKDNGTDLIVTNDKGEKVPNSEYWEENGVLPVYAGRLMNSIQRADFCGVWGSRMVMRGAEDRVPEEVDYTLYTINRVREVSLNKKHSIISTDFDTWDSNGEGHKAGDYKDKDAPMHGNYFGIYNIVNYLGALTSDFDFGDENDDSGDIRTTDNTDSGKYKCDAGEGGKAYLSATFYDWKKAFPKDRRRNNGNSHNKVALASGVYLELTTELSTGSGLREKDWGPITGVVELDLINVAPGIGGGFVYAKNQHGVRSKTGHVNTTLTALNRGAVTQWDYEYTTDDTTKKEWETSGNFVHSSQIIIDDCYNISNKYKGDDAVPAHYWYIKGSVYVYDQYISAYTGIPNAYSEQVEIPLTITAASYGQMKLLDVQTNRYAYLASPGVPLGDDNKVVINDKAYYRNDPVSYWDYYLMGTSERTLFTKETYVNCVTYYDADGTKHEAGTVVMTTDEFNTYKQSTHTFNDAEGHAIKDADDKVAGNTYIFRLSNNVSHDNGYILTYNVNNPTPWDTWYTPKTGSSKVSTLAYSALDAADKSTYNNGPTYRLKAGTGNQILGQDDYSVGDVISQVAYYNYEGYDADGDKDYSDEGDVIGLKTNLPSGFTFSNTQAVFEPAYILTEQVTITQGDETHHQNPGVLISETDAGTTAYSGKTVPAYICTHTIELSKTEFIYMDQRMTSDDRDTYLSTVKGQMNAVKPNTGDMSIEDIKASTTLTDSEKRSLLSLATARDEIHTYIVPAYYCKTAGKYGGNYYVTGNNYRGLEAWSSMSQEDRQKFDFNYDALDLLIDPNYSGTEGQKYQYDSAAGTPNGAKANDAHYSLPQPIDYTATYNSDTALDLGTDNEITVKRPGNANPIYTSTVQKNDELTREVYEALANEQRHYTTIAVKEAGTYYVVNNTFQIGNTIYSVGEMIDETIYTSLDDKKNVTSLNFSEDDKNKNFYYCREAYKAEHAVKSVKNIEATYGAGSTVQAGAVIQANNETVAEVTYYGYDNLTNQQKNFVIQGISPTETSTLYVSRNSDIYDLSKEKIITVIYQYDYEESDQNGHITPVSERHVLNIHLQFKSGVPIVEEITKPDIILPGEYVGLQEPNVTPGAYEITGHGWTLFENPGDAESHINGIEYDPNLDPLYWYQHNWYVSFYAKTYLGRTYSNSVPVSVANYHDLANVMSEANKKHHMYIDNANVLRDPKIYINDYSESGKNGLDELKRLYDLSVLTGYTTDPETGLITSGDFKDHKPLDPLVKGGANLDFFMRTDIDHSTKPNPDYDPTNPSSPATIPAPWTPIGDASQCFEGTFNGDGHTISGLDKSLFGELCGSVYNLGVTGSFTSAGVADTGKGYVESCWVKTTGTTPSAPKPYAVFGNPTASPAAYQTVNSYFCDSNTDLYKTATSGDITTSGDAASGLATAMSERAFYNGTVAYDLNNFYLYKRYCDKNVNTGEAYQKYRYYLIGEDNKPVLQEHKYYTSNAALCSSGTIYTVGTNTKSTQYVEERFADGDFRYAAGTIPTLANERLHIEEITEGDETTFENHFYPIWPDDYIFFGQMLTYGHSTTQAHQDVPTAVARNGGRLSQNDDANRVYRAPAYYRNSIMGVAHFNPHAYLAQTKKGDASILAYPEMTAIDFNGHQEGHAASAYKLGLNSGWFYQPLLDDDGLLSIRNIDETKNLLAYAPAETATDGYANAKTYGVLNDYFTDPDFYSFYDELDSYRRVSKNDKAVFGHVVQSDLTATNDHLLVDKQDFNAPFRYHFGSSKRMWYQRLPESYVDRTNGWEGVSLPFAAELVTTQQKGELTHFYDGSETSKNGTSSKIAHEYWLRNYKGVLSTTGDIVTANLSYPSVDDGFPVVNKKVDNTFLWDYYYEAVAGHNHKDLNLDTYQTYYETSRTYHSYPLLGAAQPYIIGFPSNTYYEFDLSGTFAPNTTAAPNPAKLDPQIITFASETGITINVSDNEMGGKSADGYTFKPNYLNETLPSGYFVMNSDGNSYTKLSADDAKNTENKVSTALSAFRPYFTTTGAGVKGETRSIIFSNVNGDLGKDFDQNPNEEGELIIRAELRRIIVTSTLQKETTVNIVDAAGALINTFSIQPGETVITNANTPGIYLVNKKKLSIR